MPLYAKHINAGGTLFLSGFLSDDELTISDCAKSNNFSPFKKFKKENWLCLGFTKS